MRTFKRRFLFYFLKKKRVKLVVTDFRLNCDTVQKLGFKMWTAHTRINAKNN
jgi:hypothetical protein